MKVLIPLIFACVIAVAQDTPKPAAPPAAAPTISLEHEAAFLAAEHQVLEGQRLIRENQPLAQQAAAAMQKDCGGDVARDPATGRFSCAPKPPKDPK